MKVESIKIISVVVICLLLASIGLSALIPYVLITLAIYNFQRVNSDNLYILFLILLPLKEIVNVESMLFGFLPVIYVVSLLSVIKLTKSRKTIENAPFYRIIRSLIFFLLFIQIYIEFKNVYFDLNYRWWIEDAWDLTYSKALRRTIKLMFYFVTLLLIVHRVDRQRLNYIMRNSLFTLIVVLLISQVFSSFLVSVGISSEDYSEIFGSYVGNRSSGLLAYGDVNSLGAVYTIIIGLYLVVSLNFKSKLINPVLLNFLAFGVLYTLSRGAMIGMLLLLIVYLYYSKSEKKKLIKYVFYVLIGLVFFFFLSSYIVDLGIIKTIMYRFSLIEDKELVDTNANTNRLSGWVFYLDYILNDVGTLIRGTSKMLVDSNGFQRPPHNIYIFMVFHSGLAFLFYYLLILVKINYKNTGTSYLNIIIVPFLFMTFLLHDFAPIIFLCYSLITLYSYDDKQIIRARVID